MTIAFQRIARAASIGTALIAFGTVSGAQATDGYFQLGYGPNQKGVAEAVVAHPQDALTLATNPAGLVFVGNQFNASLAAFSPDRGYTGTGTGFIAPGSHDSGQSLFGIPSLSYSRQIDGDSAWGVAFYGNGGMNTAYSAFANPNCGGGTGVFCGGKAGVDLTQAFLSVGYARKFGALSVGVAPVLAVQRFKANGLAAFAGNSSNAAALTNNGFDYAYGAGLRGGVQWDATKTLRFGLSGATPIYSTKFDKYAGLFADRGGFDIPGNIALGVAWDALPTLTLLAQYKRVFYSGTGSVGNSSLIAQPFGVAGGPGFGWKDVDLVSVGAEWKATKDLTLRAGYAKNTNPVRSAHVALNILAPGVVTDHFTGGFTYKVTQHSNVDFAVVYAPKNTISGPIPLPFGGGTAKLRLSEFEATIGYTYKFDTATAVVAKY